MKKTLKTKYIIALIVVLIISFNINVCKAYSIDKIFTDAQNFIEAGEEVGNKIDEQALKNTSSFIFNLLFSIGMVVAVAIGIVLGIQFMVASAEDKAKVKEALIAYAVGCLVLFGAYGIWKLVITVVQGVFTI